MSLPISTVGRALALAQHLADGMAEAQHEVGRDRRLADRAADAVGAEIGSAHGVVSVRRESARLSAAGVAARQTVSAATVAATSWTRTMRAPRCTASTAAATLAASSRARSAGVARGRVDRCRHARQRRLARPADQQRHAERQQLALARQQREVVRQRLAEADAGIERRCARASMPGASQRVDRARAGTPRPRRRRRRSRARPASIAASPCMCIRQTPQRGCAATASSAPGARSAPDVVDDVGAQVERGAHHLGLVGVDRDRHAERRPPRAAPAARAPALRRSGTGSAPGRLDSPPMSRMSAPSREQLLAVRDRAAPASSVAAAVGERIGRDVDDAHHARLRQVDREAGGLPDHRRARCNEKRGRSPVSYRHASIALRPRPARCPACTGGTLPPPA